MKKLKIAGVELADYCTKYDDGTIKVTVPLAYQVAAEKATIVGTEVTITSNASKNAKGAISSLIKVSAPYMAFDKDLVTGEWTANKRRSGASVSAHLVLTIPQALVNDDAAGFEGAKQQLALMLLMLDKHLGALRADVSRVVNDSSEEMEGLGLAAVSAVKDLDVPSDSQQPTAGRFVRLPTWKVIEDGRTRLGHALQLDAEGEEWVSSMVQTVAPSDEDTSLARALTGKRLIDCETPSYEDVTLGAVTHS